MNSLPQILIDPIVSEKDITETSGGLIEDCRSLTVPFAKFLINTNENNTDNNDSSNDNNNSNNVNDNQEREYFNYNDNLANNIDNSINFGQTIVGKILIRLVNGSSSDKYYQLVWVQIYNKSSSISSRLNTHNLDIPAFVLLLKTKTNPRTSEYIPDYYSLPYMQFNLKHTRSSPIDEKHFHIYTRCGEGVTLQAEIADEHSVAYWLSIFNQNTSSNNHVECLRTYEIKARSAPNSPRHIRRRNIHLPNDIDKNYYNDNRINLSVHSLSRTCVFETLSETQETES
ncbi:hypothetical protein EWB00_006365 [Schistosoma japonicum]|uniref:SJCHGC06372 protein n=1 Tax=Schistosoma japonicum TaxID=6182 RepID=Q5DD60_SCHJA|nr:SJCHGC06372 protein [Schistosoma japonicum]TNN09286.1 hypothetical protein EWB00_006365 [Schistosoma japonicum]